MQWAISKSHESIGERGEKLLIKEVRVIGDQAAIGGEITKVGAGGHGMGVKLAVSNKEDQSKNKKNLKKFLKCIGFPLGSVEGLHSLGIL